MSDEAVWSFHAPGPALLLVYIDLIFEINTCNLSSVDGHEGQQWPSEADRDREREGERESAGL